MRDSLIVKNTLWMLIGHSVRTILQAVYFILLARAVGATGYGAFIGVSALVAILAPFASLGSGNILIKHVARDAGVFRKYWGNAIALTFVSGGVLLVALLVMSRFMLPRSITLLLVVTIGIADLLMSRLSDISGQAYQALQRLGRTAQLQVLGNLARLGGVVALILVTQEHTPGQWGIFYLASAVLSAALSVWLVCRELGKPQLALSDMRRELKEGSYFSIGLSAASIYNDIDKTMLARLSTLHSAGIYGAAYRLIDIAFAPVRSLLYAAYARFFQHGAAGVHGSLRFALRLLPLAAAYGALAGAILFLTAPVMPWVLGAEFHDSVSAIRWLALLPLLRTLHFFAADTLTGAGHQGIRSAAQVLVALFNVVINFWWIPAYSWLGAAWSSLLSDGLLAVCLWALVWRIARSSQPLPQACPVPVAGGSR
jgi:O-antigen/teichoic acid export membrane protein